MSFWFILADLLLCEPTKQDTELEQHQNTA